MLKIVVLCMAGFSSSILKQNIEEAGKRRGLEVSVSYRWASFDAGDVPDFDVILLAPHLAKLAKYSKLQNLFQSLRIPIGVIDGVVYGTADGEKIVDQVLDLISEKKKEGD